MGNVPVCIRVYEEDCKEWDDMAAKLGLERSAFIRYMVKKGIEHEKENIDIREGLKRLKSIFFETKNDGKRAKGASPKCARGRT